MTRRLTETTIRSQSEKTSSSHTWVSTFIHYNTRVCVTHDWFPNLLLVFNLLYFSLTAVSEVSVGSENPGGVELQRERAVSEISSVIYKNLKLFVHRFHTSTHNDCHFHTHYTVYVNVLSLRAEGGRRRGYMGHLTRIANSIVHNSDKGPNGAQIQQLISGRCRCHCTLCVYCAYDQL